MRSSKLIVDMARLPAASPLTELYRDESVLAFVQAVACPTTPLFVSSDPYNGCFYNMYEKGDGLGYHFDVGEFGVNLILQQPDAGGVFESHPNLRSDADEGFAEVAAALAGQRTPQAASDVGPGSLVIFAGRRSLHRVTPVAGSRERVNAILHYERDPEARLSAYSLKKFFGREQ
jgi:hypothetical protein